MRASIWRLAGRAELARVPGRVGQDDPRGRLFPRRYGVSASPVHNAVLHRAQHPSRARGRCHRPSASAWVSHQAAICDRLTSAAVVAGLRLGTNVRLASCPSLRIWSHTAPYLVHRLRLSGHQAPCGARSSTAPPAMRNAQYGSSTWCATGSGMTPIRSPGDPGDYRASTVLGAGGCLLHPQGSGADRARPCRWRPGPARFRGRAQPPGKREAARPARDGPVRLPRLHRGPAGRPVGESDPRLQH